MYDWVMAATPVPATRVCSPFRLPLSLYMLHHVNHRKLVGNNRANILRDFKFRTVKQLLASQPDIEVVDKVQKRAAATDEVIPSDSNRIGEEHRRAKIWKYQELIELQEAMWKVKSKVISGGKAPILNLWQIPGPTSEVFVKKDAVRTFRNIECLWWFPLHVCIYTH